MRIMSIGVLWSLLGKLTMIKRMFYVGTNVCSSAQTLVRTIVRSLELIIGMYDALYSK